VAKHTKPIPKNKRTGPRKGAKSDNGPRPNELLQRLAFMQDVDADTAASAKKLVARAHRASVDAADIGKLAIATLVEALRCSRRTTCSNGQIYQLMCLVLQRAGHDQTNIPTFAVNGMAHALAQSWWLVRDGNVVPTEPGLSVAAGEMPTTLPTNWKVTGLPAALYDLARALEKHGGEAKAKILLSETGRNPADTITKYPNWQRGIDAHINRVRRGVYRLE
jgi:hypothetical protein